MAHNKAAATNKRFITEHPLQFQGWGNYQPLNLEGKYLVGKSEPNAPRYKGYQSHKDPLGPLTSLNKHVNFVNPFGDFFHLCRDMTNSLFKAGKSFKGRIHDAYSRIPPPW